MRSISLWSAQLCIRLLAIILRALQLSWAEVVDTKQLILAEAADSDQTRNSSDASSTASDPAPAVTEPKDQSAPLQQPKRILGIMPNFRAVSAGTIPPPPTMRQSFKIATENSFDYSSYIFVGFTSALAEWTDTPCGRKRDGGS